MRLDWRSLSIRPHRRWLRYALPAAGAVLLLAGGGLAALETDTVETYWQGVWWALSLMTTVGYTGEPPHALAGHLIAASVMVLGFLLLALTTAAVASLFVLEDERPEEAREHRFEGVVLEELVRLRRELADVTALLGDGRR